MNKSLKQVRDFHQIFEHPIGENSSHVEPLNIRQLRIKLLFEELVELVEASDCRLTLLELSAKLIIKLAEEFTRLELTDEQILEYINKTVSNAKIQGINDGNNVNKLEELDALCDLQYVLNGKILTAGLQNIFDREFEEVHKNNMSKAHYNKDHALKTLDKSLNGKGTIKERNGYFIVLNESLKVIKPWDHKKVELSLKEE